LASELGVAVADALVRRAAVTLVSNRLGIVGVSGLREAFGVEWAA